MKHTICQLLGLTIGLGLLTWGPLLFLAARHSYAAGPSPVVPTCDRTILTRLETDFKRLVDLRAQYPGLFSEADYKAAALNYISRAEACYQVLVPQLQGISRPVQIDQGGLWMPGFEPERERYSTIMTDSQQLGVGTKWPNVKFSGGIDKPGPGQPGGRVTYSFMPAGAAHAGGINEVDDLNISVLTGLQGDVDHCVRQEVASAFATWGLVADIQFDNVPDSGHDSDESEAQGDIRIGAHSFTSLSSPDQYAHAFFPPPNGNTIAGDIHLNSDVIWSCDPAPGKVDIGLVMLHEVGHTIGLGHEPPHPGGDIAVMNAVYNPNLTFLQPDDREGISTIYGPTNVMDATDCLTVVLTDTFQSGDEGWKAALTGQNNRWILTSTLANGQSYWLAQDSAASKQDIFSLASPVMTARSDTYLLSFQHIYSTEYDLGGFYDGGFVEISSTTTSGWQAIDSYHFFKNGYNGQIDHPVLNGIVEASFSGDSGTWTKSFTQEIVEGRFRESTANLSEWLVSGDRFQVQFSMFVDHADHVAGVTFAGWAIDNVTVCEIKFQPIYLPVIIE